MPRARRLPGPISAQGGEGRPSYDERSGQGRNLGWVVYINSIS